MRERIRDIKPEDEELCVPGWGLNFNLNIRRKIQGLLFRKSTAKLNGAWLESREELNERTESRYLTQVTDTEIGEKRLNIQKGESTAHSTNEKPGGEGLRNESS